LTAPATPLTTTIPGLLLALALGVLPWAGGCQHARPLLADNQLTLTSRDRHDGKTFTLPSEFTRAIYRYEDRNSVTVLLIQGSADAPERVAAFRMFWRSRAGLTPLDSTATNTLVRMIVFRDTDAQPQTVGIYAGAGFMRLHNDPTLGRVAGSLWDADLRLTDRSEAFADAIGRAALTGSFTADRDDAEVTLILRHLNQQIEQRLGYPRLVKRRLGLLDAS